MEGYVSACRAGAAQTMAADPEGPCYHEVQFTPSPKPATICKLANDGFGVQSTYCVQATCAGNAVHLNNVVYGDFLGCEGHPASHSLGAPVVTRVRLDKTEWRIAYRTQFPESAPIKLDALAGRLAAQSRFKKGPAAMRRELAVDLIIKQERARAKARRKAARVRELMGTSSSSTSDSSDSSSSP